MHLCFGTFRNFSEIFIYWYFVSFRDLSEPIETSWNFLEAFRQNLYGYFGTFRNLSELFVIFHNLSETFQSFSQLFGYFRNHSELLQIDT